MRNKRVKALVAAGAAGVLMLTAACQSEREAADGEFDPDATLIIGTEGEIRMLDPSYSPSGTDIRVGLQIFDTLLKIQPGLGDIEIVPSLATSWEPDDSGTQWTFQLRDDVTFHDGEPFNAEAVCTNFERWHNATGGAQDGDKSYYWISFSGGFAQNEPDRADLGEPAYGSCEATGEHTAVINLTRVTSAFPSILVLPTFAMHSPLAMETYNAADIGTGDEADIWPEYALEHPTGTGAFRFVRWDRVNEEIHLERNDDYWGEVPGVQELIFKAIPDETQRVEQLLAGEIHGFDLPAPADWDTLEEQGMELLIRDVPVNLLYIGMTQDHNPALEDVRVRQAIAHAVNREGLIQALMPEGAELATQFQPPTLPGWSANVQTYDYNPDQARDLLAEAGFDEDNPLELEFWWPTEVTRPYMPSPQDMIELVQPDLEAVGIVVTPVSRVWGTEYIPAITGEGEGDLHFLGWTGDYPDGHNFFGTWFSRYGAEFGFTNEELFAAIAEADQTADPQERFALYEQVNEMIMEFLPGVPISHMPNGYVMRPGVEGFLLSPLATAAEPYNTVRIRTDS